MTVTWSGSVIEAQNGNTLVTTLDANIQSIVEQEILNFNQQYTNENGLGSKNTAVLVMDPDTAAFSPWLSIRDLT